MRKILVLGACGQIGTELVIELARRYGKEAVIASDIREQAIDALSDYSYCQLDVLDKEKLSATIQKYTITEVYLLAALLSATAEKNPDFAWKLNMDGLFNVLNLAKDGRIEKVFWPSSIAVFGPTTPRENTPQQTVMEPSTVYGISKLAGERWCEYYHAKYGVDVRSIRYPGLISYGSLPGGGTTDYAVDIFYHAKKFGKYTCFLSEDSYLPMMYMEDAIRATIELMEAPIEKVKVRSSYNLAGISFSPKELVAEIRKKIPLFEATYEPDFRQKIADSWPKSVNDNQSREDWGWKKEFDLAKMTSKMIDCVDVSKMS